MAGVAAAYGWCRWLEGMRAGCCGKQLPWLRSLMRPPPPLPPYPFPPYTHSPLTHQVYSGCLEARLRHLLHHTQLVATVNSDDPAYFGGWTVANYAYLARVAELSPAQLAQLAANSFQASFLLDAAAKQRHTADVAAVLQEFLRERDDNRGSCSTAEAGPVSRT